MRRRDDGLAQEYAELLRPLLPQARKAYGQQKQGSPARAASDKVNALLLEYDQKGGNITQLAEVLDGALSLPGLHRRLRVARAGTLLGVVSPRKYRGDRDPGRIADAVEQIKATPEPEQGVVIRQFYEAGLSLSAIAKQMGVQYYAIWSKMQTAGQAA